MQKEDTSLMTVRSYCKQARGDISDDKTASLSTRGVFKHSISDCLKCCVVNKRYKRQDGCNAKCCIFV